MFFQILYRLVVALHCYEPETLNLSSPCVHSQMPDPWHWWGRLGTPAWTREHSLWHCSNVWEWPQTHKFRTEVTADTVLSSWSSIDSCYLIISRCCRLCRSGVNVAGSPPQRRLPLRRRQWRRRRRNPLGVPRRPTASMFRHHRESSCSESFRLGNKSWTMLSLPHPALP